MEMFKEVQFVKTTHVSRVPFETYYNANEQYCCLQGYVIASYNELVELFGQPDEPADKISNSWNIQMRFSNVTVVSDIYDYKEDLSKGNRNSKKIWHIGGSSEINATAVGEILARDVYKTFSQALLALQGKLNNDK